METINNQELKKEWESLVSKIAEDFDADPNVEAILFLIGVQELGKGYEKFSKNQKMDLMHIATCIVLEPFGYYKLKQKDEDGWPHFEKTADIPNMPLAEQDKLVKRAIIAYFRRNGYFPSISE